MTKVKKLINQSGSFEDTAKIDWQPMELFEDLGHCIKILNIRFTFLIFAILLLVNSEIQYSIFRYSKSFYKTETKCCVSGIYAIFTLWIFRHIKRMKKKSQQK